jgi:hypothetical protein
MRRRRLMFWLLLVIVVAFLFWLTVVDQERIVEPFTSTSLGGR